MPRLRLICPVCRRFAGEIAGGYPGRRDGSTISQRPCYRCERTEVHSAQALAHSAARRATATASPSLEPAPSAYLLPRTPPAAYCHAVVAAATLAPRRRLL